jgi:Ca2+/Na+ antiporter
MGILIALVVGGVVVIISLAFKLAKLLRLTIPIIYIGIVLVFFRSWYDTNVLFANAILGMLIALVLISWVITVCRKVRSRRVERNREELDLIINSKRLCVEKNKQV